MKETKALMESKNSIFEKIKKWFGEFIKNGKIDAKESKLLNKTDENIEKIFDPKQENIIINNATKAFENYVLNEDNNIADALYKTIEERIKENKDSVENLIELTNEDITYEKIIELLEEERINLVEYKKTIKMEKTDNNFVFSAYQVPVGTIGIEAEEPETKIRSIFKAITTRNAVVVIELKEALRSIDKLILLVVKEHIHKFGIDENIIQFVQKEQINEELKKSFDMYITKEGNKITKNENQNMYICEQDEYFRSVVEEDIKRLMFSGKKVELIRGKTIEEAAQIINKNKVFATAIYSKDGKQGYKFVNLVRSKNAFLNGTLLNAKEPEEASNEYFTIKNIMSEDIKGF